MICPLGAGVACAFGFLAMSNSFAFARGFVEATVYERYAFRPGSTIPGPALFEARESTVVAPPDARVHCDAGLTLVIDL